MFTAFKEGALGGEDAQEAVELGEIGTLLGEFELRVPSIVLVTVVGDDVARTVTALYLQTVELELRLELGDHHARIWDSTSN
jgi:hypothetical protein